MLNVTHWVDTTGALDIDALVSAYIDDVVPDLAGCQSDGVFHTAVRYRIVSGTPSLILEQPISPAVQGANGGTGANSYDALSIKWTLGDGTVDLVGSGLPHIKRGGMRIGGINDLAATENGVSAGTVTVVRTFTNTLLTPQGGGWNLVVASFLDGARARQRAVQSYAVVTAASDPGASTQSSRKFLRGRAR
jgi:hypothetical protein